MLFLVEYDEKFVEKANKFMRKCFEESGIQKTIVRGMIRHLEQTRNYVKKFASSGKNTVPLEIAALLHGIERAFYYKGHPKFKGKIHEEKSAIIAEDFLRKERASPKLIKKVRKLILLHEKGGTKESELLRDADIVSFLENTLPIWVEARLWIGDSKEQIIKDSKEKIEKIYNLINNEKAKEIAKPFHKKWKEWLEKKEEASQ